MFTIDSASACLFYGLIIGSESIHDSDEWQIIVMVSRVISHLRCSLEVLMLSSKVVNLRCIIFLRLI